MHPVFLQAAKHCRANEDRSEGAVLHSLSEGDAILFQGECLCLVLQDDGISPQSLTLRPRWDWRGSDRGASAAALGSLRVTHAQELRSLEALPACPGSNAQALSILHTAMHLDTLGVALLPAISRRIEDARTADHQATERYQIQQSIDRLARTELAAEALRLASEGQLSAPGLATLRDIVDRLSELQASLATPVVADRAPLPIPVAA